MPSDAELAFAAIAEVEPGGHFFAAQHTMERYQRAFYTPLVSDWRNFGSWSEDGSRTATMRANRIWKDILRKFEPPKMEEARAEALASFIARRTAEGGALPESLGYLGYRVPLIRPSGTFSPHAGRRQSTFPSPRDSGERVARMRRVRGNFNGGSRPQSRRGDF